MPAGDLEAWQRICWWEGPDSDGYLWLMVDFKAAIEASRTHGPDLVARVLVSNVSAVSSSGLGFGTAYTACAFYLHRVNGVCVFVAVPVHCV
jgi:hypothetical protein